MIRFISSPPPFVGERRKESIMKKIFAILLLLALAVTCFISCNKDGDDTIDGDISDSISETESETDTEAEVEFESDSETETETKKKEDATVVTGDYTPFY